MCAGPAAVRTRVRVPALRFVKSPTIQSFLCRWCRAAAVCCGSAARARAAGRVLVPKFERESQLVVLVEVGRLEEAADALLALQLRVFRGLLGQLAVLGEQFGVVASELLQTDEEVAQVRLELGKVVVVQEQAFDELSDLNAATNGLVTWALARGVDLRLQVGEGVLQEIRHKVS